MPEYTYKTVPVEGQEKVYRCKVVGDSTAILFVGHKPLKIFVRETSGNGFTLGIDPKLTKRISAGKRYELRYDDRRIEIIAESFVETVQGEARLRVGTIREFEPVKRWAFRLPFTRGSRVISHESGINSGAAYGGFVLVLFCVMSLPGIGDKLGTAPRIESALQMMSKNVGEVVRTFRN
ncbi:MAG: hypothetical protein KDB00_03040 [Planctomycetales bacterium]|nr:hypothetical protein [Planctomycetales bacterium]